VGRQGLLLADLLDVEFVDDVYKGAGIGDQEDPEFDCDLLVGNLHDRVEQDCDALGANVRADSEVEVTTPFM